MVAFPSCIINGSAVTKTFQILYRNEEVRLESVANFKVHVVAETGKVGALKPKYRGQLETFPTHFHLYLDILNIDQQTYYFGHKR